MSRRGNGIFQSLHPSLRAPQPCLKQEVLIYSGVPLQKTLSCTLKPRFLQAQMSAAFQTRVWYSSPIHFRKLFCYNGVNRSLLEPRLLHLSHDNHCNLLKTRSDIYKYSSVFKSPDRQHLRQCACEIKQINAAFPKELGARKHSGVLRSARFDLDVVKPRFEPWDSLQFITDLLHPYLFLLCSDRRYYS